MGKVSVVRIVLVVAHLALQCDVLVVAVISEPLVTLEEVLLPQRLLVCPTQHGRG